jgi:hypothetical protein
MEVISQSPSQLEVALPLLSTNDVDFLQLQGVSRDDLDFI